MNSAESEDGQKTQAEQTITIAALVAIVVAIFVSGSVLEVLGASIALTFPFYNYFEPADYLRIAPSWGSSLTAFILTLVIVESFFHYRGRKIVTVPPNEWDNLKMSSLKDAILFSVAVLLASALYIAIRPMRLVWSLSMPFICVISAQFWVRYVAFLPHFPRRSSTVHNALFRIAPQMLIYSFAFGLFTVGPQMKGIATVLVQIKSEPVTEIRGRLAYVLNKYVILKVPKSTVSERSHFIIMNAAEILKIEQLPAPSPTPSTSPSITPEKKRS
jgi:hypothetical protein